MEIIKEVTEEYREFSRFFDENTEITLRHYYDSDRLFMRLDDGFARANGYGSMKELHALCPGIEHCEWMDVQHFASATLAVKNNNTTCEKSS